MNQKRLPLFVRLCVCTSQLTFYSVKQLFLKSLLFLFFFSWGSALFAQTQLSFKEPGTSSPTAAGFQKFIDIPVSNHTGVPNISIPYGC